MKQWCPRALHCPGCLNRRTGSRKPKVQIPGVDLQSLHFWIPDCASPQALLLQQDLQSIRRHLLDVHTFHIMLVSAYSPEQSVRLQQPLPLSSYLHSEMWIVPWHHYAQCRAVNPALHVRKAVLSQKSFLHDK